MSKNRFLALIFGIFMILLLLFPLSACTTERFNVLKIYMPNNVLANKSEENGLVIKSVKDEFQSFYQKKVKNPDFRVIIEYYNDYSEIITKVERNKESWDLIYMPDYTTEYMIQKDLLLEIDTNRLLNYKNISPFIKDKYYEISKRNNKLINENTAKAYTVANSWGTTGLIYNKHIVGYDNAISWDSLWNDAYRTRVVLKKSARENYVASQFYSNKVLLKQLYTDSVNDSSLKENHINEIKNVLSQTESSNLLEIAQVLQDQKVNVDLRYDSGNIKSEFISGLYVLSLSTSKDAIEVLPKFNVIEDQKGKFDYVLPKEGTNLWLEGWSMPIYGQNIDASMEFLDFMLDPDIAVRNMKQSNTTTALATEETLQYLLDASEESERNLNPIDVSYFFTGLDLSEEFNLQSLNIDHIYIPSKYDIDHCVLLQNFGNISNLVTETVESLTYEEKPNYITYLLGAASLIFIGLSVAVASNTVKRDLKARRKAK